MTTLPSQPGLPGPIRQIAFVVQDLDVACRQWSEQLRVGPWSAFTLQPPRLQGCTIRGEQIDFGLRHALAWSGDVQFELVQPTFGPSIFAEQLVRHGEGLHHLGIYVDGDLEAHSDAVRRLVGLGHTPLQSAYGFGAEGDGAFAYFHLDASTPIVELISAPEVRVQPDFVVPNPADIGR